MMGLSQVPKWQGGYDEFFVHRCCHAGAVAHTERVRALKRIIPRARVQAVLRRTGHARRRYLRLPAWFMVWFVIALGLFCRDNYRQVFKWLQPFRRKGTPGRSTFAKPANGSARLPCSTWRSR